MSANNNPGASHQQGDEKAALERYVHIIKKIQLMWGTKELDAFISELVLNGRDGARAGFPVDAAEELMVLAKCNKLVRAIDLKAKTGTSLSAAYKIVDEGDETRLNSGGLWNDPGAVTKDTLREGRQRTTAASTRETRTEKQGAFETMGKMIFALVVNKWFLAIVITVMTARFLLSLSKDVAS